MPEYTVTFRPGSGIDKLYQRQKKKGVKNSKLDTGYPKTDYVKEKRFTVDKNNHQIQSQEVLGYSAKKDDENSRKDIQETLGYIIPWRLDDSNPKTTFDKEIREKVDRAAAAFKAELGAAGHKEGSNRYKELLAVALSAFVMSSDHDQLPRRIPFGSEKELRSAGLGKIVAYIDKNGGLDLINIKTDCESESTALEALQNKCGQCTEQSEILYAVFRRAGLNPQFILGEFTNTAVIKFKLKKKLHVAVALNLGDRTRYFDPNNNLMDAERSYKITLKWWFEQTNREALTFYYINSGSDDFRKGDLDGTVRKCKKALEIDPNSFVAHACLGYAYEEKNQSDLAAAEYEKTLELNPQASDIYGNLGYIYAKKGLVAEKKDSRAALWNNKKALAAFQKTRQLGRTSYDLVIAILDKRVKDLEKKLSGELRLENQIALYLGRDQNTKFIDYGEEELVNPYYDFPLGMKIHPSFMRGFELRGALVTGLNTRPAIQFKYKGWDYDNNVMDRTASSYLFLRSRSKKPVSAFSLGFGPTIDSGIYPNGSRSVKAEVGGVAFLSLGLENAGLNLESRITKGDLFANKRLDWGVFLQVEVNLPF